MAITADGVDEAMKSGAHDDDKHLLTSSRENGSDLVLEQEGFKARIPYNLKQLLMPKFPNDRNK
jgi:hypothetical protein